MSEKVRVLVDSSLELHTCTYVLPNTREFSILEFIAISILEDINNDFSIDKSLRKMSLFVSAVEKKMKILDKKIAGCYLIFIMNEFKKNTLSVFDDSSIRQEYMQYKTRIKMAIFGDSKRYINLERIIDNEA